MNHTKLGLRIGWLLPAIVVLTGGTSLSADDPNSTDPFAPTEARDELPSLPAGPVRNVAIHVEYVEVDIQMAARLLLDGKPGMPAANLHEQVQKLVDDGKAKVADVLFAFGRTNEATHVDSVQDFIYPIQYHDPVAKTSDGSRPKNQIWGADLPTPAAFETRNVGTTLAVRTVLSADEKKLLAIKAEIVRHVGDHVIQEIPTPQGRLPIIQQPVFYALTLDTRIETPDGVWQLASVMSPPDEKGRPSSDRKLLVFLRATVQK